MRNVFGRFLSFQSSLHSAYERRLIFLYQTIHENEDLVKTSITQQFNKIISQYQWNFFFFVSNFPQLFRNKIDVSEIMVYLTFILIFCKQNAPILGLICHNLCFEQKKTTTKKNKNKKNKTKQKIDLIKKKNQLKIVIFNSHSLRERLRTQSFHNLRTQSFRKRPVFLP